MSVSAIDNKFPLFGWNVLELMDLKVADSNTIGNGPSSSSLISDSVVRQPGLRDLGVVLIIPDGSWTDGGPPTNKVNVFLEGSNDNFSPTTINDHWTTITELDLDDFFDGVPLFIGGSQIRLLGANVTLALTQGEGLTSVQRYQYLRARAEIIPTAGPTPGPNDPLFDIEVQMVGVGADSERFSRQFVMNRASGVVSPAVTIASGTPFLRPGGTRYLNVQVVVDDIELDGGNGFSVFLQGSLDEDGPYFTIAAVINVGPGSGFNTLNQSEFLVQGQAELIDMGPFQYFQILGADGTGFPVGGLQRYTMTSWVTFDGNDLQEGEIAISRFAEDVKDIFLRVVFSDFEAQAGVGIGANRNVSFQILDMNGRPVRETRPILVRLVNVGTGNTVLSTMAEISAVVKGTPIGPVVAPGLGVVESVISTDVDGVATITVMTTVGPPTDVAVTVGNFVPSSAVATLSGVLNGQVVIQCDFKATTFLV